MTASVVPPIIDIRPYQQEDESDVLELLSASLGAGPTGARSADFFRWKHLQNPFGRSHLLVADNHGRIIGLRAFMRWTFRLGDRTIRAVRAVDTATHPDFQGLGVFTRLTRTAIEQIRDDTDLIFNTPNEKSLPGYLKMGWTVGGRLRISVRICHPLRFASAMRTLGSVDAKPDPIEVRAEKASDVLTDEVALTSLVRELEVPRSRLATARDESYLRWRYGSSPLDYRAVVVGEVSGFRGLAIFRVRSRGGSREGMVTEVLVRPGDVGCARALLRGVRRAASVDHLTALVPTRSAVSNAAARSGFIRAPRSVTLTYKELGGSGEGGVIPKELTEWALTLGDAEVF